MIVFQIQIQNFGSKLHVSINVLYYYEMLSINFLPQVLLKDNYSYLS